MDKNKIIKTIRNIKLNSNLKVKLNDGKMEVKVKKIN